MPTGSPAPSAPVSKPAVKAEPEKKSSDAIEKAMQATLASIELPPAPTASGPSAATVNV